MKRHYLFIGFLGLFILSGCSSSIGLQKPEFSKTDQLITDVSSKNFKHKSSEAYKLENGWVETFEDETLKALINEAMENNPDIHIARSKIDEANSLVKISQSQNKPTISLAGRYRDKTTKKEETKGGAVVAWEADLWGRIDSQIKASQASLTAIEADYLYARHLLAANVAKSWFNLQAIQSSKQFIENLITIKEEQYALMNESFAIGKTSKRDAIEKKIELNEVKKAYSSTMQSYENAQRALEVLLGRYPEATIQVHQSMKAKLTAFPVGMPIEVLERRPDIIAAQSEVSESFYNVKAAKLLRLPSLSFSLNYGYSDIHDFMKNLKINIFTPLYTGGKIEAQIKEASAIQQQSIANYAQKVLVALNETQDTIANEVYLQEQNHFLQTSIKDNEELLSYEQASYTIGKGSKMDILLAKEDLISSQIAQIDIQQQSLNNRVNMFLALGGDFE